MHACDIYKNVQTYTHTPTQTHTHKHTNTDTHNYIYINRKREKERGREREHVEHVVCVLLYWCVQINAHTLCLYRHVGIDTLHNIYIKLIKYKYINITEIWGRDSIYNIHTLSCVCVCVFILSPYLSNSRRIASLPFVTSLAPPIREFSTVREHMKPHACLRVWMCMMMCVTLCS